MILPAPNPRLLVLTRHHGSARSSQRRNGGRPSTGDSRRFTTRTCGARHGPRQATTIRLAVSILVAASLLTGCGGGSSPPESQPATGSPAGHSERGTYASTTFLVTVVGGMAAALGAFLLAGMTAPATYFTTRTMVVPDR